MGKHNMKHIMLMICITILVFPYSPSLQIPYSFNAENMGMGNIYYVDQNHPLASDSNPGTEDLPWLTVQKAADTMVAGDTVYIKEGIYNERVIPKNSGSPGNYIAYIAYPGDTVTINGENISLPSDWGGLFDISDKSYIKVSGLRITNAGPNDNNAGILVDNSSHIIIERNYIYNTVSSGIGVWNSNNVVVDGNEVELACNDGEQECITMANTNIFEIRNNHVHHGGPGSIGGEGIDVKDGSSNGKVYGNHVHHLQRLGIYVDAWDKHTYNIEVFQNIVHNCNSYGFAVASEAGGLLENIRIYNNIAYDNEVCGIGIAGWGFMLKHPMRNIKVINNNFYNNGEGVWGGGISVENSDAENIVIRNNICSQNLLFQIQVEVSVQNLTVDHNLIDGYRGYEDEIYGDDYVEGDPMFVNPSGADFHLQKNSPAIDNGSPINAPTDDFDGNPRPQGKGYDIGAYEYCNDGKAFQKGFSYAAWWNDTYATYKSDISLENLHATGTEWVSLVTTWYQDDEHSTHIYADKNRTPSDASLIHAIEKIHSMNMSIMLKPTVDLQNDVWRGCIKFDSEEEWEKWFTSYKQFISHYANLAKEYGVEQFCIGVEYVETVHREEWYDVINSVRRNYSGILTYASNWDNYKNVSFWNALDYIGIDAYFPLTNTRDPTVNELLNAWKKWHNEIENFSHEMGKGIIFTEIGYCSQDGANIEPWNWEYSNKVDLKERADCYNAAFQTFWNEDFLCGIYWWCWLPDPAIGGENDTGYTPFRKPAENVLKSYYSINFSIEFEKPEEGILYIFDREIIPLPSNTTFIIGKITIQASVISKAPVDRVEFYIDDELKYTDDNVPFNWILDETVFWEHKLKIMAFDEIGNIASDEMDVMIFNIG
ncbi:MAG: hypothetical protein FE048_01635 [Thermoplasmata archaeon]|nr:MAG: hypothetical protein FE048_01635 [Thermoplasmata archaeon]